MQIELKKPQEKAEETYAIGDVLLVSQEGCRVGEAIMLCNIGCEVYPICMRTGNYYTGYSSDFESMKSVSADVVYYLLGSTTTIIRKLNVKLVEV